MSIREDIQAVLQADVELMWTLTGGVHAGSKISRQLTPDAFDASGEIQPCALVKTEAESPWGPFEHSARAFIVIFFYERAGYGNIDSAMSRVYALLHRQKALAGKWELLHANDLSDQEDQALACSLALSRYQILRSKEAL